jgi:sugar lactone lactonase YvrE
LDVIIASQLTPSCTEHGEGPFWDEVNARLLVVDMLRGAIVTVAKSGALGRYELGGVAATVRARRDGGFVLATERGFQLFSPDFALDGDYVAAFDDPLLRMNDGGCDPQGRFYCGTMAYAETPGAGTLYRLDSDLSVHHVLSGVTISNGLQWHRDNVHVYYNDTPTGRIDIFDFEPDTGRFSGQRSFVDVAPGGGHPDGMAIDEAGGVWVALWGGSAVNRYDEKGQLSERIELPVRQVTACTFGGQDGKTLYVTTSRLGLGANAESAAGAVFTAAVGIRGAPQYSFAG